MWGPHRRHDPDERHFARLVRTDEYEAWLDAAEYVDDKWAAAEKCAGEVRAGFARLLGDRAEHIALGQNTHELVTRLLSALPLRERPAVVTTDAEFHSIRRQLDRLNEAGIVRVQRIAARPADTLAASLLRSPCSPSRCLRRMARSLSRR